MKRFCIKCKHPQYLNGSLYSIFSCEKCNQHFRGNETNLDHVRKWIDIVTLQVDFVDLGKTWCPFCRCKLDIIRASEEDEPNECLSCPYCSNDIKLSRVINISPKEFEELECILDNKTPKEAIEDINYIELYDCHPKATEYLNSLRKKYLQVVKMRKGIRTQRLKDKFSI